MERQVPTRRQPQATEIDTADVAYRERLRRSIRGAIVIKWDDRRAFDIK